MPKFKLSKDILELNPDIAELAHAGVSLPSKSGDKGDKKYLFAEAWQRFALGSSPHYVEEFEFNKPDSKHAFDFCFPLHYLSVEIDGGEWAQGGGRHASASDKRKMNLASIRGFRVMHFSPKMLEDDPNGCVVSVLAALDWKPPRQRD